MKFVCIYPLKKYIIFIKLVKSTIICFHAITYLFLPLTFFRSLIFCSHLIKIIFDQNVSYCLISSSKRKILFYQIITINWTTVVDGRFNKQHRLIIIKFKNNVFSENYQFVILQYEPFNCLPFNTNRSSAIYQNNIDHFNRLE